MLLADLGYCCWIKRVESMETMNGPSKSSKKRDWQQHRGMTESDGCRSHQGTGPLQLIKERHKQAILWTLPRAWMSAGVKAHKLLLAQVAPKEPAK